MDSRITDYGLDLLTPGLSVDNALVMFKSACNKHDTLFITPSWFDWREGRLRLLLDDPITADQAQALSETVLETIHVDEVLVWLENDPVRWEEFVAEQKRVREDLDAMSKAEHDARFKVEFEAALKEARRQPRPDCPDCGPDGYMIPVNYGLLDEVWGAVAGAGEIANGGCMIGEDRWCCRKCGLRLVESLAD